MQHESDIGRGPEIHLAPRHDPGPVTLSKACGGRSNREGSQAKTVLVADDEDDIRDVVALVLCRDGHNVISASNTLDAIGVLRELAVDLVLTDITMPGGDGRLVLAAAQELPRVPPVVIMTGLCEPNLGRDLERSGAAMCLHKPFGITDILEVAHEYLGA